MSLEAVIEYFSEYNMDHRVMVLENSTATVEEAAQEHGVDPDQIGKTLSFKINETPILIVVAGEAKIDNKKYKSHFFKKAKMLNKDEALEYTGHAIGGVCPCGHIKRRLFPMIKKGLKPGGVLIFESFIDKKKDYCLKTNELLHAFNSFQIVYYEGTIISTLILRRF